MPEGQQKKEIRIDVFQLDVPTISIADADKGFKVLQGSELTITPIVDSFLETSYSWQINGEDISNELTCTLPTIERLANIKFVLLLTMKMAMTK